MVNGLVKGFGSNLVNGSDPSHKLGCFVPNLWSKIYFLR